MEFKFIDNVNDVYKQKHYLKTRNLSILEFQMRIMDLIYLNEVPFMERLNYIKIICIKPFESAQRCKRILKQDLNSH